jgi:predicted ester cyclase
VTTEENKAIARRYLTEGWSQGQAQVLDELCAPRVTLYFHGQPEGIHGPPALKEALAFFRGIFPDLTFRVEEEVAEGDRVVVRWTATGTQRGEWIPGVPPSGLRVTWPGVSLFRIAGGRIVEERVIDDGVEQGTQMGVLVAKTPA